MFFRAALRLAGRQRPPDAEVLVREAAGLAGFDATAFEWPLAARAGVRKHAVLAPYDPVAAAYLAAAEKFVGYVNDLADG